MLFCPKCGSLMKPKVEGKKKQMICSCGFKTTETEGTEIKEQTKKENKPELAVIEKEQEAYPLVDQECPKCKHDKAYFWAIQTRASDEPETKFFKCEKCKHTWRDYNQQKRSWNFSSTKLITGTSKIKDFCVQKVLCTFMYLLG